MEPNDQLRIQLISFDRPTELSERFYFLEMSTLQATTLLENHSKVETAEILAYTNENEYLDTQTVEGFKTIGDFNDFFSSHSDYYIYNCDIKLENKFTISSHDDGEVSIEFLRHSSDYKIIDNIFEKYKLDKNLIETIKSKPGHYFVLDSNSKIVSEFNNFEDYVISGRG